MSLSRYGNFFLFFLAIFLFLSLYAAGESRGEASWIWAYPDEPSPKNRFTYFRKVVDLQSIPENAVLRLAADSNARLWINGQIVRRKMARYQEECITAEIINAAPYLKTGKNVVVALHHNWGDIITFQRTGNAHAGLYIESSWIKTDASWRCMKAPEMIEHEKQLVGIAGNAHRIRYPLIIDGRLAMDGNILDPSFDDGSWGDAYVVSGGPWRNPPADVETPGQRETAVRPMSILAAGMAEPAGTVSDDPFSMAELIRGSRMNPSGSAKDNAAGLINGEPVSIRGAAGETHYITFDFYRPVHGYPFLDLADAPAGTVIDFGYCELAEALYSGEKHANADGWINPEGVVGKGYGDRYITKNGPQLVEIPDERTGRWLALHIRFREKGTVILKNTGIVKSQYPLEEAGSFSCGNEWIEKIVKLCRIHAELCMSDAYIDTPGREDGQWLEDARPRAQIAASWFNDYLLRRLLIRTHAEEQGEDGDLHPFAPSNYPAYPAPYDWSVQWIAMIYDDYMWTGEIDLLKKYWSNVVRYWDDNVLKLVDEEGVWRTGRVLADIRVGVRPGRTHSSGIVTPWMIERLRWSADMANAVGDQSRAESWTRMADTMTAAFRKYHIVPGTGSVPAHVGDRFDPDNPGSERGFSQAGQTIAVYAGLLTEEESSAVIDYAFPEPFGAPPAGVTRWNNPTYCYRVLHAMTWAGMTERALRHLIERYSPYLPGHPNNGIPSALQGPLGGPLPEYWISRKDLNLSPGEINTAQPNDETGSHGWGCVPLLWLAEDLLGVRVTKPGGSEIVIAPESGGLPYISGNVMTPRGIVRVYWDPQQWLLKTSIPPDVEARITLPAICRGKRISAAAGPSPARKIDERTFVVSGAGEYVFRVY